MNLPRSKKFRSKKLDHIHPFSFWSRTISTSSVGQTEAPTAILQSSESSVSEFSKLLTEDILEKVTRPGQYLGNEWGARRKPFDQALVRVAVAFPDLYELGMSNFGLKILYQIVNSNPEFLLDRSYAPGADLESILRERSIPLWGWESRHALRDFELVGFSLQYELTYTNVLNMLELSQVPVYARERTAVFPLIFGGGPSAVNPEPMANFMDFFIIGDGEEAVPNVMTVVKDFKTKYGAELATNQNTAELRNKLLFELGTKVPGVYVPSLYEKPVSGVAYVPVKLDGKEAHPVWSKLAEGKADQVIPEMVLRQVAPLNDANQPTQSLVPYISLVFDRETLEVRRGCDRGCRFCQPGYTFLPVRERSTEDLVKLSTEALAKSGHQEYSMLSLCVSDYTSLHESVRALNAEHSARRTSLSFPSQRADRMSLELAEELKAVRKSGITLAPEAGSERLRRIINKGLNHQQIISAIESAYQAGWTSVKLYFMNCLPMEEDSDLLGIIEILKEATLHCRVIKKTNPSKYRRDIELTCTLSNFVPKPFTPFQWFGQVTPEETERRHGVLRQALKASGLRNVQLNMTGTQISLLEAVISRGDRTVGDMIHAAWKAGCTFDAWDEQFKPEVWHQVARDFGTTLEEMACTDREVGSEQPWDVIHIGLHRWWLVREWNKAVKEIETATCTEHPCHACGICTELSTHHELAAPSVEVMKKNPFVKGLSANKDPDQHPSLFFTEPPAKPEENGAERIRFAFTKLGELRFVAHLDLQHLLARAARRAGITMAYTQGFNPSPKLNLAAPLPLFSESMNEVGELDLAVPVEPEQFMKRMNSQLPAEIQIVEAKSVPVKNHASLAAALGAATYKATLARVENVSGEQLEAETESFRHSLPELLEQLMKSESLNIEVPVSPSPKGTGHGANKGEVKTKNIRPGLISIKSVDESQPAIEFELAHGSKMHVKPSDLLKCIKPRNSEHELVWRVVRTSMKTEEGTPVFSA